MISIRVLRNTYTSLITDHCSTQTRKRYCTSQFISHRSAQDDLQPSQHFISQTFRSTRSSSSLASKRYSIVVVASVVNVL